jgi:hypothetical protein
VSNPTQTKVLSTFKITPKVGKPEYVNADSFRRVGDDFVFFDEHREIIEKRIYENVSSIVKIK